MLNDGVDGLGLKCNAKLRSGLDNRFSRRVDFKRIDSGELKEAFSIGFDITHSLENLGKPSAEENDGQSKLVDAVDCGDQGLKFLL